MKRVLQIFLCLTLMSCGQSKNLQSYGGSPVVPIKNGAFPAVVKVVLPGGRGICTGTFISPRAVLTAAHCTKRRGAYRVLSSFGNFITIDVVSLGSGEGGDPNDIAILVLKKDVADPNEGQVMRVGEPASVSDVVRLVGFGCNSLKTKLGAGIKRTGTNLIHAIGNHIEVLTPLDENSVQVASRRILGPSDAAGACFGDSGGPLLREYGSGRWEVVGVSHAGRWTDDATYSMYSDVNRSENFAFLDETDDQLELGIFSDCARGGFLDRLSCGIKPASMEIVHFLKTLWSKIWTFFFG